MSAEFAASIFGELWKLKPFARRRNRNGEGNMDWLLSPTNYMIELVPSKQNDSNGRSLEIMTPKAARADIHMNLPALQKLDSMLIRGRNKGTNESKRWWLPSPQVPKPGLSNSGRKKLLEKGKVVYQVFKATKSINENILLEMPLPAIIKEAIPKILQLTSCKVHHQGCSFKTVTTQDFRDGTPWSFAKDPLSETGRNESVLNRAEALRYQIKSKHRNLPQSFLDATKIQYGKNGLELFSADNAKASSVSTTPSRCSRVWCLSKVPSDASP
ncbi:unnamed protein product [Arabis nemorensis]|uniref:PRONE domain-containing protein n=1 Tax=Arabis nemorensis TaxID=586526 RepID=A0A565AVA6_9BRAS|nr:unnamed protein product [Arabis nemorensis]